MRTANIRCRPLRHAAMAVLIAWFAVTLPVARAAEASRWWGSVGMGMGHSNLAATSVQASQQDNGLDLGFAAGYIVDPRWRIGVSFDTLITKVNWCYLGCGGQQTQSLDRFYALARYCTEPGCGGWFLQAAGGYARYQSGYTFAWYGTPEAAAMDRDGSGSGYELGVGYRLRRQSTTDAFHGSWLASYGSGHINPDFAGAEGYGFNMFRVTLSLSVH